MRSGRPGVSCRCRTLALAAVRRLRSPFLRPHGRRLPAVFGLGLAGRRGRAPTRLVCIQRLRPCGGCARERGCPFTTLFDPRYDGSVALLRRVDRMPQPFVLDVSTPTPCGLGAGDPFDLRLVVVGRARHHAISLLRALEEAAARGIGPARIRRRLQEITEPADPLPADPAVGPVASAGARRVAPFVHFDDPGGGQKGPGHELSGDTIACGPRTATGPCGVVAKCEARRSTLVAADVVFADTTDRVAALAARGADRPFAEAVRNACRCRTRRGCPLRIPAAIDSVTAPSHDRCIDVTVRGQEPAGTEPEGGTS